MASVNDPPVAVDDGPVPVTEDTQATGNVLPNDSDVDGDPLTVTQFTVAGDPTIYSAGQTAVIAGVGSAGDQRGRQLHLHPVGQLQSARCPLPPIRSPTATGGATSRT